MKGTICESTASSLLMNETPGQGGMPAQTMHWNVPERLLEVQH
jgi:hypothetical protein